MDVPDIDLSERGHLTPEEKIALRGYLQRTAVREIARRYPQHEVILHGGASLHLGLGSSRHSEDLDFYLDRTRWEENLESNVYDVAEAVNSSIQDDLPGSEFTLGKRLKNRVGTDGEIRTTGWVLKWEHPNRIGALKIKFEFCRAEPGLLGAYKVQQAKLAGESISVPAPVAAWADKVVACAMRNYRKLRDYYDLVYLLNEFENELQDDNDKREVIEALTHIYGFQLPDIGEGLQSVLDCKEIHDVNAFRAEMVEWFSKEDQDKDWEGVLQRAREELAQAAQFVHELQLSHRGPNG